MKLKIKDYIIDKNRLPKSLIVHGILYIVVVLFLAFSILFIIPIQEKISGNFVIHTFGIPVDIKTKQEGPIFLKVTDGDRVEKDDLLATQVWDLDTATIRHLHSLVRKDFDISTGEGLKELEESAKMLRHADLPEIQGQINKMISAMTQYRLQLQAIDPTPLIDNLQREIDNQWASLPLIDSLTDNKREKLALVRQRLERDKQLVQEGALSPLEYSQTESSFIDAEAEQLSTNIERKNTEQSISELESSVAATLATYRSRKAALLLAVEAARNDFLDSYYRSSPDKMIYATIGGIVTKMPEIISGMEMKSEQTIMTIVPEQAEEAPECYMYVGLRRAGEVKKGQIAYLELSEYQPRDYGMLEATVDKISPVANSERYRLDLKLNLPLTTNFGVVLEPRASYNGTGEILTNRMSIFEKIINELRWSEARFDRVPSQNVGR